MSRDAAVAYVGLDGAAAVRRVDLETLAAGTQFWLGTSSFEGANYANDIAVMPGSPGTVAIALRVNGYSPSWSGVVIYDDGVPRPMIGNAYAIGVDTIGFGSSPGTLYGYNNETTGFDLYRITVTGSGISAAQSAGSVITGFGVRIVTDGETIFSTRGATVDGTQLHLIGTYQIDDYIYSGYSPQLALDPFYHSVQFAVDSAVVAFDRDTFIPTYETTTAGIGYVIGAANCGAACLAIAYTSNQIIIVHDVVHDAIFAASFD
jgi:hypothetical protein